MQEAADSTNNTTNEETQTNDAVKSTPLEGTTAANDAIENNTKKETQPETTEKIIETNTTQQQEEEEKKETTTEADKIEDVEMTEAEDETSTAAAPQEPNGVSKSELPENSETADNSDEKLAAEQQQEEKTESKSNNASELQTEEDGDVVMGDDTERTTATETTAATAEPPQNGTSAASENGQDSKESPEAAAAATAPATDNSTTKTEMSGSTPPPPVMKGTLSCDLDDRRHLIRGMWNYENSNVFPPQRFELVRPLKPDEDPQVLPKDGEFHGSFSLAYFHTTSKGKQKERSRVIPETGVNIKFTKQEAEGEYKVDGKGTNQFGIFHINGTATKSKMEGDNTYHVVLRKRYEPSEQPAGGAVAAVPDAETAGPLPDPAKSFPVGVVCLRGKMYKEHSAELGLDDQVHRIQGMWAPSLELVLSDPQNERGLCSKFEYEHKSSQPNSTFPVSGRYSGWFDLSGEDGRKSRINERDVTLKFRKNNAGYHNVEGKGSNVFGKYSITGTLTKDHIITIFRHFQPRKIKASKSNASSQPAGTASSGGTPSRLPSSAQLSELRLKLDDVVVANDGTSPVSPITPPATGQYSAVSRGVLRVNEDGAHTCSGKWAATREHFNQNQSSPFNFRLEQHFVQEALSALNKSTPNGDPFPLDSAMYKGSFQLKKQGSRYQTIVDQQVVMKFRRNSQGSFNVHGKGINAIGEFNLIGTLVMSGKTGGQVELYRMYPPDKLAAPPVAKASDSSKASTSASAPAKLPLAPERSLERRGSSRAVKPPPRLEEDDPEAQLSRVMDKCNQILQIIWQKNIELGGFFSEPVDPVALGIPTYYEVIKEPMDLRTIQRRMEAQNIHRPEEFARLVRLVFENAITFNVDPANSVHQAARNLLVLFNQKFRDVDRMVQNIRRSHGGEWDDKGKKKGDKKRKRQAEEPKSLKRRRLDEAQAMAASNASAVSAILAAAPPAITTNVSRVEFNMMLTMIQQLQQQVVQTYRVVAELSPDEEFVTASTSTAMASSSYAAPVTSIPAAPAPAKKAAKRKVENPSPVVVPVVDDNTPLTHQEQEFLTETINVLPAEHLGGVIQIIREAAPVGADEDEIDLEIDQLDTKTQRKLLRHISKYVKKKPKAKKKPPKATAKKTKSGKTSPKPKLEAPSSQPAAGGGGNASFFAFNKDSDSDDDSDGNTDGKGKVAGGAAPAAGTDKDFELTTDVHDDDDEDEDFGSSMATSWNMTKTTETKADDKAADDDAWGMAREQAEMTKVREAERKAREEKMKADAEQAQRERLEADAAQVEKLKEQRDKEKERAAALKEQQKKEDEEKRNAAREAARAQVQSVEQTVNFDEQRDIMKEYEQSYLDKDYGSASPSSDFGF